MRTLFFLLLALLAPSASGQPVAVPGTRVSLAPPPGFVAADRFAGFEHADLGASILVVEVPAASLADIVDGFTAERLAEEGVIGATRERVEVGGVPSLLVTARQAAFGQTYRKWILVTGDSVGVVMLNGTIPIEGSPAKADLLRASLLTLSIGKAPTDLFEGLPFTVDLPEALPERQRLGASLLLEEGVGGKEPPGAPLVVIALGAAPLGPDLAAEARARIQQTVTVMDMGPVETTPVTVGGRRGVEATAEAADEVTGEPISVSLVLVRRGADGYVIFQSLVGTADVDVWRPRFRAIRESLVWR